MSVSMKMEGAREVIRNIEQFPKKLQRRILNAALRDSAKPIIAAVRTLAPRKTGALRRSIKPTTVRAGRIGPVMLINVGIKRTFKSKKKGTTRNEDAYYARFVEFGTAAHAINPSGKTLKINGRFVKRVKRHPGTSKQLFFTRAIDSKAQESVAEFGTKVRERLAQVRSANSL